MNNLKIKTKLMLLLLLPILGLLFLAFVVSYDRYNTNNKYQMLDNAVILSTKMTSLVHELQKERGMTAGYLGSKGIKFKNDLPNQRELTNKRIKEFQAFLKSIDTECYGEDFNKLLNDIQNRLSQLDSKRNQISTLQIGGKEAIAYFTNMNGSFLEVVRKVSSFSPNNEMTQQLNSYTNFLLSKERAGIERAVGAVTFAAGNFLPGMKDKFSKLIIEQNAYLHSFEKLTNKQTYKFYSNTVQGKAISEVKRMRESLLASQKKHEIVSKMKELVGYGGMIHYFKNYVIRGDEKYKTKIINQYEDLIALIEEYKESGKISDEEDVLLTDISLVFSKYYNGLDDVTKAINSNVPVKKLDKIVKVSDTPAIKALNKLSHSSFFADSAEYWFKTITSKINLLKKVDDHLAKELIIKAEELSSATKTQMIVYIILCTILLVISLILGRLISQNIVNGIRELSKGIDDFFSYLKRETNEPTLLDMNRADAIGIMAKKVNDGMIEVQQVVEDDKIFMTEIEQIIGDIKKGHMFKRLDRKIKSPNLEQLRININEMLEVMNTTIGGSINKITDVLNSYANLDFTNNITNAQGHVETHIIYVGDMITNMLIENKKNGLTIDESAKVLLENVDILNTASNEAAASLEETAAALEQMTGSISHNTDNVIKMSAHAKEVTTEVQKGQVLANETTHAMDEINTQVSSISEAITVIDQIAFQTNILSLNAAVEAATAGEAGKGFAVVAQEVRNLASRSAEAANEIKALVENATSKANDGKDIATRMTDGYANLNSSISKTIELINDVTDASKEQQIGIEQINDAVTLLDQQTQKNAAAASQTKDIAEATRKIASKVVQDADEKEFIGKSEVQAMDLDTPKYAQEIAAMPVQNIKKPKIQEVKKSSVSASDDDWDSF